MSETTPAAFPAETSAAPAQTQWRRVHPLTPVANSWAALVALFAVFVSIFTQDGVIKEVAYLARNGMVWIVWLIGIAVFVAVLLISVLFSYLAWRFTSYAITDEAVLYRRGIIFKSERHMRLNRIQAVDVIAPLVPRLLGLGKLHVDSAGDSDSKIDVAYLKISQCQALRAEVLAKAAGLKVKANENGTAAAEKLIDVGNAGLIGELPPDALQASETTLYEIPTAMLLGSIMRSLSTWMFILLIPLLAVAGFIPAIVLLMTEEQDSFIAALMAAPQALIGVFAGIITLGVALFQQINQDWGFTAAISPDGIRLRHGLTTHDSQTIPPGRVHAVVLKQPFLWRGKDWWKVELTMAGYQGQTQGNQQKTRSYVLMPVGTRQQALQALWMMERDLGVVTDLNGNEIGTAGTDLLSVLMYGSREAPGLFAAPRRARWLDWITWRRKAAVLTTTMVMIRNGRITRRVSFVPHARLQSVAFQQGPLERVLKLANVKLHLVPGVVPNAVRHLPQQAARSLWELQVDRADMARDREGSEEWMLRVTAALT